MNQSVIESIRINIVFKQKKNLSISTMLTIIVVIPKVFICLKNTHNLSKLRYKHCLITNDSNYHRVEYMLEYETKSRRV